MSSPHRKLINLLCLSLLTAAGLVTAAANGSDPDHARGFQSYDQLVESFGQIVPGMTQAQDLPNLGFDTRIGAVLSPQAVASRFLDRQSAAALRDCIQALPYCNAYVFHPGHAGAAPVLFGLGGSRSWSAEITLLVMNGRVTDKVLS
jgi:hypothetical protein